MLTHEREIFHRLLVHFFPEHYSQFFSFFDEKERSELEKLPVYEQPLQLKIETCDEALNWIHYSWFTDAFLTLHPFLQEKALGLFQDKQLSGLAKELGIAKVNTRLSKTLRNYLKFYFLKEIGYESISPRAFIPPSSLSSLLELPKKKLVELIRLLGLTEVAQLSKKIVDSSLLKALTRKLSAKEKLFFSLAQKQSEPKALAALNFAHVLETDTLFRQTIEKRGIQRFARALVLEHPFFIWHLAHQLDRGRGQHLLIYCRRYLANPYTPFYQKQLLEYTRQLEEDRAP